MQTEADSKGNFNDFQNRVYITPFETASVL